MRRVSYQQFAIVQGTSAQQLTEMLNQKLYELKDKNPTVTFEGLIARISYMEEDVIEENRHDLEKTMCKFKCRDCPFFEPTLKKDGTVDRRTTLGRCEFSPDGYTLRTSDACQRLYEMIDEREVGLCLKEE